MANEITLAGSLKVVKSGVTNEIVLDAKLLNMAGENVVAAIQAIGTSWELVNLPDITAAGRCAFKNLDAVNPVELALDVAGTNKFANVRAGDLAIIPLSSTTLYAKATGAEVQLAVLAAEE